MKTWSWEKRAGWCGSSHWHLCPTNFKLDYWAQTWAMMTTMCCVWVEICHVHLGPFCIQLLLIPDEFCRLIDSS
jgi:hypothetical protein